MLGFDPLQTEIHRKALENIVNEMAVTLVRTSGSPIVTDSKDFSTCILDAKGEHLALSAYVLLHASTGWLNTLAVMNRLEREGKEVHPGDGWIVNDPYTAGSAHQGDVGIAMPSFYHDKHVGWAFANLHVLDIGGMGVSGIAPTALTVYDEALRFPAIKIICNGKIDDEWRVYIEENVRTPGPVLNDIRAMMAANKVAEMKLEAVIDRFGLERHQEYCERNKDLTEMVLRRRIEALPDGKYEAVQYLEYDARGRDDLIEIRCTLEVAGSDLNIFLTGDPQYVGPGNGTKGAVYGGVMTQILTMLGYGDLPYNAGMWRPLTIDLGEEGTVVNARRPAPVSTGHGETGNRVGKAVREALNQAASLSSDPVLRSRIAGLASEATANTFVYGKDERGEPSLLAYLDTTQGTGGGAQTRTDGQDMYGTYSTSGGKMPDVELHEAADPVRFLWRRIAKNSGGPGQRRGGQGLDQAFVLLGSSRFEGFANRHVVDYPPPGFGGGFPPRSALQYPIRATQFEGRASDEAALGGTRELIAKKVFPFALNPGDVMSFMCGGGGGLGDPLLRPAELVAQDVRDRYITLHHAKAAYGVILTPDGSVDIDATERCRAERRHERIDGQPERECVAPVLPGLAVVLSEGDAERCWTCGYCDSELAPADEDWRHAAIRHELPLATFLGELEMQVQARRLPPQVKVIRYYCAACAGCLTADMATDRSEPRAPVVLARAVASTSGA